MLEPINYWIKLLLWNSSPQFSKKAVEDVQRNNKICILDIDTQGVKLIKKTTLNPILIFMKPPSMEVLEERLRARSTETEESLEKRMSMAKIEMEYGNNIIWTDQIWNFYIFILLLQEMSQAILIQ